VEFWNPSTADPRQGVGARHHAVPNFHLKGFADQRKKVWLSHRERAHPGTTNIDNIAFKDFYTYLNNDGQPDGRFEQLLHELETDAANVFRRITSPILANKPLSDRERESLCLYVAFQLVRGPRKRREIEVLADLGTRLRLLGFNESEIYQDPDTGETWDLSKIEVLAHPNEHISIAGNLAIEIFKRLIDRPIAIVEVTQSSFIICDEPVMVDRSHDQEEDSHTPPGAINAKDIVHIRPTAVGGVESAEEIAMPLARRWLLALGPRKAAELTTFMRLDPDQSREITNEANAILLGQAYQWAVSHPDDRHLLTERLPPLQPLFHVCGLPDSYSRRIAKLSRRPRPQSYGRR
jgi:Protein of unknown function (DUF4238)